MMKGLRHWGTETLVVFACCIALGAYEAEAALVDPENRAAMLLSECGYLPSVDSGSDVNISEEEMVKAFSKFQAHMGIDVTGSLNAETFRLMNLPGCGEADIVGSNPVSRSRRDANPEPPTGNLFFRGGKYPTYHMIPVTDETWPGCKSSMPCSSYS